jgi:hypothetical protein
MAPHPSAVASGAALLGALVIACAACDDAPRRETSALLAAVDRYVRADNGAKATRAEAVAAVACTAPDVCAAKQACLAAIGPTVRALTLKDDVAARVAALEASHGAADAAATADLPGKLDEAERLLKEGHEKMGGCETALADLRLRRGG